MRVRSFVLPRCVRKLSMVTAMAATLLATSANTFAQFNNGFFRGVVGGVSIDADGVLRSATMEEREETLAELRRNMVGAQGELKNTSNRRMISLKTLSKIVEAASKNNESLPEEVLFLGGLTRIENVFVIPESNDIVLSGPSEPWTLGPDGSVVGTKSGRPVVYLDDLLCAFKTVMNAHRSGVSVSIEPTAEGVRRLEQAYASLGQNFNPSIAQQKLAEAFGPQQIRLEGVPSDSHMARVILAADYKMKLYGMNLAKAPVKNLPSYLEMISGRASGSSLQSRWWMACDYNSVEHSKDKLAWKISGRGVKTLTEQEYIDKSGNYKQTNKVDALAKKWADNFTSKLDELAVKDPVFGELRNVMDLCVVAALIHSEHLQSKANCDLTSILGDDASIALAKCDTPKSLDPQVRFLSTSYGYLLSASGGVMVDSWQVIQNQSENEDVAKNRDLAVQWSNTGRIWQ